MKKLIIILVLIGINFSCKKDRLKDETELLIGKWNWDFTERQYGWCDGTTLTNILTPETEDANYSIVFDKKGYVEFYKNDTRIERQRIVIEYQGIITLTGETHIIIRLDNDKNSKFTCIGKNDEFGFSLFPFTPKNDCELYSNSFIREK